MKRLSFLLFTLLVLIISCKSSRKTDSSDTLTGTATNKLIGKYIGNVGADTMMMYITTITADSIRGYCRNKDSDIYKPFRGAYSLENGIYKITASDDGHDNDNGVYAFSFDTNSSDVITGNWKKYGDDESARISYSLQRKTFLYSKTVGMYPEASQRALKDSDVDEYSGDDLQVIRNEIYARHGYCFKNSSEMGFFVSQDWYVPVSGDVKSELTVIEKKNIPFILKHEKYAKAHDEDYGR
ncbi:MAG TPA: YARHG domain-containing protein [Ferruginibacter sp.]|jgi:hypothetical protein|nr:YARHG domain-containing protein [Ferruginibacter sp.]